MTPLDAFFYYLAFTVMALITLLGAIGTVALRNVFHAGLSLVASFFGVAGLYLLLEAEFLAIVQVLLYVGAIAILILFAIMLTRGLMRERRSPFNAQWGAAAVLGLVLFAAITAMVVRFPWKVTGAPITVDITGALGQALISTYVLPFEIASLVLLAALIGAFVIARE